MTRFAVVATLQRGVLAKPELLDEDGQAAVFWQLRMDESQSLRAGFEVAINEARVVWNQKRKPVRRAVEDARVERMVELARRVG